MCKHSFGISFQSPSGAGLLTCIYHRTFLAVSRGLIYSTISQPLWTHTWDRATLFEHLSWRQQRSLHDTALSNYCLSLGDCKSLELPPQSCPSPEVSSNPCPRTMLPVLRHNSVLMPKHTWAPVYLFKQSLTSCHGALYHPGISHLVSCSCLLHVVHMEGKATFATLLKFWINSWRFWPGSH